VRATLALVLGTGAFIGVADSVREGDTQSFDERAVRALRRADDPATPLGPRWLHEVGRDLTALGGVVVLSLLTLAVVVFLLLARQPRAAGFVVRAGVRGLALPLQATAGL